MNTPTEKQRQVPGSLVWYAADGSYFVAVDASHQRTGDERPSYAYRFHVGDELVLAGDDLHGGCRAPSDLEEAHRALGSFLSAWLEARGPGSESWDLFPESAREAVDSVDLDHYVMAFSAAEEG